VAVCAKEHTFIQLRSDFLPAAGVSLTRDTKILLGRSEMMKLQRFRTPIVTTSLAAPTFIGYGSVANHLSPFADGSDEIVATIGVCAALSHESPTFLQPAALPTELPGNLVQPKRAHSSMNWWGGSEPFLARDTDWQRHVSATRRNPLFRPHPRSRQYCLLRRMRSASPRLDIDFRCRAWYRQL
jgi:hypothetical protein